jgi:hypothetical protein
MHETNIVIWKEGDAWLGYLEQHPDSLTQCKSLEDLEAHLKDLAADLTSRALTRIRRRTLDPSLALATFGKGFFVSLASSCILLWAYASCMTNPTAPDYYQRKLKMMFSLRDVGLLTWPVVLSLLVGIVMMTCGLIDAIRAVWPEKEIAPPAFPSSPE